MHLSSPPPAVLEFPVLPMNPQHTAALAAAPWPWLSAGMAAAAAATAAAAAAGPPGAGGRALPVPLPTVASPPPRLQQEQKQQHLSRAADLALNGAQAGPSERSSQQAAVARGAGAAGASRGTVEWPDAGEPRQQAHASGPAASRGGDLGEPERHGAKGKGKERAPGVEGGGSSPQRLRGQRWPDSGGPPGPGADGGGGDGGGTGASGGGHHRSSAAPSGQSVRCDAAAGNSIGAGTSRGAGPSLPGTSSCSSDDRGDSDARHEGFNNPFAPKRRRSGTLLGPPWARVERSQSSSMVDQLVVSDDPPPWPQPPLQRLTPEEEPRSKPSQQGAG